MIMKRRILIWINIDHSYLFWLDGEGEWLWFDGWFLFGIIPIYLKDVESKDVNH